MSVSRLLLATNVRPFSIYPSSLLPAVIALMRLKSSIMLSSLSMLEPVSSSLSMLGPEHVAAYGRIGGNLIARSECDSMFVRNVGSA